ncbi:MAG: hypothetical protein OEM82_14810 [Acidobacteriota bacterium]|nr:hypothetical protein [Acidobacteriota bacterium]MDH3530704.1 hypothetical protein [Acidobacteriota bacterium]
MKNEHQNLLGCNGFEENLSDYIEGAASGALRRNMAEHALKCPLCHSLLNEVREAVEVCRKIGAPESSMTSLEAKILSATMPETAMGCADFEEHLTDYLDGFLPAMLFHRWERHAVLCEHCTDLPGEVVRSIAACYTYKVEELPVPFGLTERILESTIGTAKANSLRPSRISQAGEWLRGLRLPISAPQLAPVAVMLLFAVLVFSQTGGNSIGGVYQKSFELAGKTYQQGADIVLRNGPDDTAAPTQGEER